MIQRFWIPVIPRGQGRPRAAAFGKRAKVYKDARSREHETTLAALLIQQRLDKAPADVGVDLWATYYFPRPKYHYNTKGQVKERYREDEHIKKPDLSNLVKAIEDAGNGILWHDDCQITRLLVMKRYVAAVENGVDHTTPGILCNIEWTPKKENEECTQKAL